mmetsp:Transcript_94738/g.197957  ORF Transcript_94738/g.197957 Transcript_94738/m.197957 type:complete len:246 (-) Transcript_94738:449-1186(-)
MDNPVYDTLLLLSLSQQSGWRCEGASQEPGGAELVNLHQHRSGGRHTGDDADDVGCAGGCPGAAVRDRGRAGGRTRGDELGDEGHRGHQGEHVDGAMFLAASGDLGRWGAELAGIKNHDNRSAHEQERLPDVDDAHRDGRAVCSLVRVVPPVGSWHFGGEWQGGRGGGWSREEFASPGGEERSPGGRDAGGRHPDVVPPQVARGDDSRNTSSHNINSGDDTGDTGCTGSRHNQCSTAIRDGHGHQ